MYKQFDSLFVSPMKIGKKYFKEYNTKIAEILNTALTRLSPDDPICLKTGFI